MRQCSRLVNRHFGKLGGMEQDHPASARGRQSSRFTDHRLQPFQIRRPVKHFIANHEAWSAADAEGLRKCDIKSGASARKPL